MLILEFQVIGNKYQETIIDHSFQKKNQKIIDEVGSPKQKKIGFALKYMLPLQTYKDCLTHHILGSELLEEFLISEEDILFFLSSLCPALPTSLPYCQPPSLLHRHTLSYCILLRHIHTASLLAYFARLIVMYQYNNY